MKVYGVTGLPGSGKSIISRIAKNEGIHIISMGDVVRQEAEKNNCSSAVAAVSLRKRYGNNVIADRCVKQILNHSKNRNKPDTVTRTYKKNTVQKSYRRVTQDVYLVEGIRSHYEVKYFKRHFKNFKVIAIHSSPEKRFHRLKKRRRIDDSTNYNTFLERERRELKFGIGNVIAHADFMLVNDGAIPNFKYNVKGLIQNELKPKHNRQKYSKRRYPNKKYSNRNYNKPNSRNKNNSKNKNKQNRRYKQSKKQYNKYDNRRNRNKNRK